MIAQSITNGTERGEDFSAASFDDAAASSSGEGAGEGMPVRRELVMGGDVC